MSHHSSFANDGSFDHYERGRSVLYKTEDISMALRQQKVSKLEYFGIIKDILKMQKNVCLCRHFQRLNKGSALGQLRRFRAKVYNDSATDDDGYEEDLWKGTSKESKKAFLDVWLVDFFAHSCLTNTSDTTSLFILQLACIVNMVPRWKKLKVRVFIILPDPVGKDEDDCNNDDTAKEDDKCVDDKKDIKEGVSNDLMDNLTGIN